MSSIAISGNTSGTGEFSLEAPVTTADRNITLADASGNVVISDSTTITADYTNNRFSFGGTVVFNGLATNFNKWEILNANTSLVANKNYFANTQTTLTLTLPTTANIGDTIRVFDNEGHASANVVTISRNGNKIDGFDRNVVISTDRDGVELVYVGPEVGFVTRDQQSERPALGSFQGSISGYVVGGVDPSPATINNIQKFSLASDQNGTDVGNLTAAKLDVAMQSSDVSGYASGGNPALDTIEKFPFAIDSNATDVGDLTGATDAASGSSSFTHGYISGGVIPTPVATNKIEKFPFAIDTNGTDVGDLVLAMAAGAGISSPTHGYRAAGSGNGLPHPSRNSEIEKFPFAVDTNATDVGDITTDVNNPGGCSSTESGYVIGGNGPSPSNPGNNENNIEKFPFASDTNATDIGNLTQNRAQLAGISSVTHGYGAGGNAPPVVNTIDKFPFASNGNATDVADLHTAQRQGCMEGAQN
jgi:hypothetical protein